MRGGSVSVPRVSSADDGLVDAVVLDGVYEALLGLERARAARWAGRVVEAASREGCFRRPRHLLEALEAGRTVVVGRAALVGHWMRQAGVVAELPWDDRVRFVAVTVDDVVSPAEAPQ